MSSVPFMRHFACVVGPVRPPQANLRPPFDRILYPHAQGPSTRFGVNYQAIGATSSRRSAYISLANQPTEPRWPLTASSTQPLVPTATGRARRAARDIKTRRQPPILVRFLHARGVFPHNAPLAVLSGSARSPTAAPEPRPPARRGPLTRRIFQRPCLRAA